MGSNDGVQTNPSGIDAPTRRVELDRLRTIACLSTFLYHGAQIFDHSLYHIKSTPPSAALDLAARLMHAVRMPLFFFIAGMVAFIAMQRMSDKELLERRIKRLLPPFIVGIVLFTPWIKYLELLDGRNITWRGLTVAPFVPELPTFLRRYYTMQFRYFSWSHMWFPVYLLLMSTALLPVLRRMARVELGSARYGVALIGMPLAILLAIELLLRPHFPYHIPNLFWDWASVSVYGLSFLSGAAIVRWPELETALRRNLLPLFALGLAGALLTAGPGYQSETARGIARALWLWAFLGILAGGATMLARGEIPGERYLGEATLPLYVLHHLPLVAIGFFVKDMPWPIWQRYVVIVLGAILVTLAVYNFLIRPFAWPRAAFGMPPLRRAPPISSASTSPFTTP